MAERRRWIHNP